MDKNEFIAALASHDLEADVQYEDSISGFSGAIGCVAVESSGEFSVRLESVSTQGEAISLWIPASRLNV